MNQPTPKPGLLITPVQWMVGGLAALVLAGLITVTIVRDRDPERLDVWFPPGSSILSQLNGITVLRVSGNLSNATAWYANRLSMGYGGSGASFQYRSTGITPFSRGMQRGGINRMGSPTNAEATTILLNRSGKSCIFHITQQAGESNAIVHIVHADAKRGSRRPDPPLSSYPRVSSSSTSSSGALSFHIVTANTNLQGITEWYSQQLGLSGGSRSKSLPAVDALPLPTVMGRPLREAYFLRTTDNTVTLVYAVEKAANSTEVVVSVVAR